MAINAMNASMTLAFQIHAEKALSGFQNIPFDNQVSSRIQWVSTTAAGNAGGGNAVYAALLSLENSANTTLDLTNLTDPYGSTLNMARVKGITFELLSVSQDSTNGTNCTNVTIGGASANHALAGANGLFNHTSDKVRVNNGGWLGWATGQNAGALVVNESSDALFIENQDSGNNAALRVTIFGST